MAIAFAFGPAAAPNIFAAPNNITPVQGGHPPTELITGSGYWPLDAVNRSSFFVQNVLEHPTTILQYTRQAALTDELLDLFEEAQRSYWAWAACSPGPAKGEAEQKWLSLQAAYIRCFCGASPRAG